MVDMVEEEEEDVVSGTRRETPRRARSATSVAGLACSMTLAELAIRFTRPMDAACVGKST